VEQSLEAAKGIGSLPTPPAVPQVLLDRPGGGVIQSAVEIGSEAAAGDETNHHVSWTPLARIVILMGS
jgi:hypothetical protein